MSTSPATAGTGHEVISHAARRERNREVAKRIEAYAFESRASAIEQLASVYDMDVKTVQSACRRNGVRYPGQKSTPAVPASKQRNTRTNPPTRRASGARA